MLSYAVINLFLAITIVNTFFLYIICLTLNYHVYFDFDLFTFYIDGMFQSKFPFKDNKILS